MSNITHKLNNCNLTVETCIFQLVKIALKRRASAIAVRFDYKQRKIQVVDNSYGYTKSELASIFNKKNEESEQHIFVKIRCTSNAVIVTSKHELSSHTYVKVANKSRDKFIQGYDRPSKGTTVTVYDYSSSSWIESDKNYTIAYVLAALAFIELEVILLLFLDMKDFVKYL
ncbi:uncharacterized protein LOC131673577 [Phymastichus coffea]|uniref:uncharacterized protein LOC131673577 n=1 Tax=Phymastichus coffea TaxID=108790 RepID=UPI00273C13BF|nr:uncharacterized protein LOC131673577 [Phymastichus coffea]